MNDRARSQTDRHPSTAAMRGRRRRLAGMITVLVLGMALIGVSAQASSSGFSRLTPKPEAFTKLGSRAAVSTKLGSRAAVSTKLGSRAAVSTKLGSGVALSTRRSALNLPRANAAKLRLLVSKLRFCNRWFLSHNSHWWAPLVWRMCVGRALSTRPSDPPPPADTTPPDTTIDAAPPASTESRSATFTFSSSETGSSFQCKLDSGSWADCDSPQFYSGLSVADHTLLVRATDAAGNVDPNPAVRNWTVEATSPPPPADTTPPQTSIGSGPAGGSTQRAASFSFSSTEAGSSFQCKLDSASWAACSSPQSYSGLAVADHTFSVRATDAAGQPRHQPGDSQLDGRGDDRRHAAPAARRHHTSADDDRLLSPGQRPRPSRPASPSAPARRARASSAGSTRPPAGLQLAAVLFGARGRRSHLLGAGHRRGRKCRHQPCQRSWTIEATPPPPPRRLRARVRQVRPTRPAPPRSRARSRRAQRLRHRQRRRRRLQRHGQPQRVVVSSSGGSMGHLEIDSTTGLTIRSARFRSVTLRGANGTTIANSTIGGTSSNRHMTS